MDTYNNLLTKAKNIVALDYDNHWGNGKCSSWEEFVYSCIMTGCEMDIGTYTERAAKLANQMQVEENEWKSVQESYPLHGDVVLVFCPDAEEKISIAKRVFNHSGWAAMDNYGNFVEDDHSWHITHWKKLPSTPL